MNTAKIFISATVTAALLATAEVALSDDDDSRHFFQSWFNWTTPGIASVKSEVYEKECSACHFAYQPGLLPALSWERIMETLDDHFGENAELDEDTLKTIRNFLLDNSAGRVNFGLSNKIIAAQRDLPAPLRITKLRYFVYEHNDLSRKMVQDNPKVKSFSNCDACHRRAKEGVYDEHGVRIPGYGRWDDD